MCQSTHPVLWLPMPSLFLDGCLRKELCCCKRSHAMISIKDEAAVIDLHPNQRLWKRSLGQDVEERMVDCGPAALNHLSRRMPPSSWTQRPHRARHGHPFFVHRPLTA